MARTDRNITATRRGKPVGKLQPPGRRNSKRDGESDGALAGPYKLPDGLENMATTEFGSASSRVERHLSSGALVDTHILLWWCMNHEGCPGTT